MSTWTPISTVVVPAQSGRALSVPAGQGVQIVDSEGQQVGDLWALDAHSSGRWLSTGHTRDRLERMFPLLGQSFVDTVGEPILEFVADTSPGYHDLLFPPCSKSLYESEGLVDHPNCEDNFRAAIGELGLSLPIVPEPVNVFQRSDPQPDGRLPVLSAMTRPGDSITVRALRDLTVVLTACSVDYWPTNGDRCTPLEVRLFDVG